MEREKKKRKKQREEGKEKTKEKRGRERIKRRQGERARKTEKGGQERRQAAGIKPQGWGINLREIWGRESSCIFWSQSEFIAHGKNAKLWTPKLTPLAQRPQQDQTEGLFYSVKES